MNKVVFISVVRDFAMYDKCVRNNPNCAKAEFISVDNREKNEGIPIGYNHFLDSRPIDEEAWYVFCHEDFELKEPFGPKLDELNRNQLWGPIGAATEVKCRVFHKWVLRGQIEECRKDGTQHRMVGASVELGTLVETFDCQCLIVHSSLVQRFRLRFDEHLTFDLYAEDFCIAAKEKADVPSCILPVQACHWSGGSVQPRYYEQESYLNGKWKNCCYTGTSSWVLGGSPNAFRRLTVFLKSKLVM